MKKRKYTITTKNGEEKNLERDIGQRRVEIE